MRNLRERWSAYRPTKADAFWVAAGGIAATLIVGFGFGGWVTGDTAQEMAARAAADSRNKLAAAVCVEDFLHAENASARLTKLKKEVWYQRSALVSDGGWATMPDRTDINYRVAEMCAEKLSEMQIPMAAATRETP